VAPRSNVGVLRRILGIGSIPGHAVRQIVGAAPAAQEQLIKLFL
jgi:hypothetical protein